MNRLFSIRVENIPASSQNSWNHISINISGFNHLSVLYMSIQDRDGYNIYNNVYLRSSKTNPLSSVQFDSLCFIPSHAHQVRFFAIGIATDAPLEAEAHFRPLTRARASVRVLMQAGWSALPRLVRDTVLRPTSLLLQFRQLLTAAVREAQTPQLDYDTWIALFDDWSEAHIQADAPRPSIAYLVHTRRPSSEALTATLRSIACQRGGEPAYKLLDATTGSPLQTAIEGLEADYIGILQAGEVLPQHATCLAAVQLEHLGHPGIAIADDDHISLAGQRHDPHFKPRPNDALMLSGTLSRGLWLVKRALLQGDTPTAGWAEASRLSVWFAREGRASAARIPYILSHRRPDTETAPPDMLIAPVERHLEKRGPAIAPIATWPITFRLRQPAAAARITAIIPSTLRQADSVRCIQSILDHTDYPAFDVRVAVMQSEPLDAGQQRAAGILNRYSNAQVSWLPAGAFNFSTANNKTAKDIDSEYLLLLNDDVSPIGSDWLRWMAAFLHDPRTGVVGARLLYPDGKLQHGGLIMGLAGLCEHAHRNLPRTEPGYMHRAMLAQEFSAVTAACMLVRRDLYERLGGLDEGYPSAFNDVDFALRVRESGYAVVYAPQAELYHHESRSFGSHHAGDRAAFYAGEVRRLRTRWADVIADDPFHNPNLGLNLGFEWEPAFPPRLADLRQAGDCASGSQ